MKVLTVLKDQQKLYITMCIKSQAFRRQTVRVENIEENIKLSKMMEKNPKSILTKYVISQ